MFLNCDVLLAKSLEMFYVFHVYSLVYNQIQLFTVNNISYKRLVHRMRLQLTTIYIWGLLPKSGKYAFKVYL